MWKIFKRKTGRTSVVHALFERCASKVESIQRRCADYLNLKVSGWSAFRIKVVLVAFIFCYVAVTAFVLFHAGQSADSYIRIQPIYHPRNILSPDNRSGKQNAVYMTERIRQFRAYLDSLNNDKMGRSIYDSIVKKRPGLIDSLTQLESLEIQK